MGSNFSLQSSSSSEHEDPQKILENTITNRCKIVGGKSINISQILNHITDYNICNNFFCDCLENDFEHEDDTNEYFMFMTTDDKYGYVEYYKTDCEVKPRDIIGFCVINTDRELIKNIFEQKTNDIKPRKSQPITYCSSKESSNELSSHELSSQEISAWDAEIEINCSVIMDLDDKKYTGVSEIIEYKREKDKCIHCGYGISARIMFKQEDGSYGFAEYWSGCLSYEPNGSLIICETLEKLDKLLT